MLRSLDQFQPDKDVTAEALIARVKDRDDNALEELYRRHVPMLRVIIGRIIDNDGDTDDLIHEVFLQIWNSANNYSEKKGQALGWIVTIARRRAIDNLRRKQSYYRMQERMRMEPVDDAYQDTCEKADSSDVSGIFKKFLSQLPAAQREALHLSYYCHMSQREIAARTGIPLGTIKTRLQLAVEKIRTAVLCLDDFKEWFPSQNTAKQPLKHGTLTGNSTGAGTVTHKMVSARGETCGHQR